MVRQVRLLPGVLDDVTEAADWYDHEASVDIGDRFLETFYAYLPLIEQGSEGYQTIYKGFRRVLLRPFPYSLYYRNHEDWAVVSIVVHSARNPRLIKQLLRERDDS